MPKTKTKKRKTKPALPAANGNGVAVYQQARPPLGVVSSTGSYFGAFALGGRSFVPTPYNPDDLARRKGIKIYRDMLRDEQVKAALSAKKFAVLSTGWEVHLPDTDEASDTTLTEYKDFVEFNFNEMKGSFDGKILDILTGLAYGFSCSEKEYWSIDYGPFKGKWGLKNLRTRPPDELQFEVDSAGDLTKNGVWQNMVKMPSDKFVIYSHANSFGNYYGESDLKSAFNAWWVKTNLFRVLPISMERFAEPIAIASFEGTELQADQRSDLESFLKNLQSRSGIVLPKSIELKLMEPSKDVGSQYKIVLDYCDQLIRMAILMPSLMGMSSEQQVGSLARSQTEFDIFLMIISQLRRELQTAINEQIVKPLLDFNYEIEHGQYPCFKFKEVTEEAKQNQYQLFLMGLTAGALTKGPEDENALRDLINMQPLPQEITDQQEEIEQAKMDNELEMAKMGPMPMVGPNGNGGPVPPNGNGNGNQPPSKKPPPTKPGAENYAAFSEEQEAELIEYVRTLRAD